MENVTPVLKYMWQRHRAPVPRWLDVAGPLQRWGLGDIMMTVMQSSHMPWKEGSERFGLFLRITFSWELLRSVMHIHQIHNSCLKITSIWRGQHSPWGEIYFFLKSCSSELNCILPPKSCWNPDPQDLRMGPCWKNSRHAPQICVRALGSCLFEALQ